jgi:hypothetical protein
VDASPGTGSPTLRQNAAKRGGAVEEILYACISAAPGPIEPLEGRLRIRETAALRQFVSGIDVRPLYAGGHEVEELIFALDHS